MNNCNTGCYGNGMQKNIGFENNMRREAQDSSCGCTRSCFPVNTSVAMAYIPFQQSDEIYACERALSRGTVFPCLDKPFLKGCCR